MDMKQLQDKLDRLGDLDYGKSQIAHGETVRETANMISFMADVIGIRDDLYIGKGNAYMREVSRAVAASVFDRYRVPLYKQASYRP